MSTWTLFYTQEHSDAAEYMEQGPYAAQFMMEFTILQEKGFIIIFIICFWLAFKITVGEILQGANGYT